MNKHHINYELIATELADALPWNVSAGKVERVAQAVLKVYRRAHQNASITSPRGQAIYDYVMSLRDARLDEDEKEKRLVEFIDQLSPEGAFDLARLLSKPQAHVRGTAQRKTPDFSTVVHDHALAELLQERWKEANSCIENKSYLAATILMGSLLEGLLLAKVMADTKTANASPAVPKNSEGKPRPFHEWGLGNLLDIAYSCGWLRKNVHDISLPLRDYRNIIHPWHQLADGICPDENSCKVSWEAVRAVIAELTASPARK
jgi:hypothetical protein